MGKAQDQSTLAPKLWLLQLSPHCFPIKVRTVSESEDYHQFRTMRIHTQLSKKNGGTYCL